MNTAPIKAIHYFCVAARHMSFKAAAEELSVTPGAVSQQVKVLERWLGAALFERGTRVIRLTRMGEDYFKRVGHQLNELLGVSHSISRQSGRRQVKLALPPGFAQQCFAPALAAFFRRYPQLELQTNVSVLPEALSGESNELAVRHLSAPAPGLVCEKLQDVCLMPVCSAEYLATHPGLQAKQQQVAEGNNRYQPADVSTDSCLIYNQQQPDWHKVYPLLGINPDRERAYHCNTSVNVLDAVRHHVGIGLLESSLIERELASGELRGLLASPLPASRHMYVVYSDQVLLSDEALIVKDWLLDTFGQYPQV
ncbi:LysR substrate-binding domain-containing protein [Aliamphritea hakodatensis]|uniref:LysR substrate-binding domain-containing protein n=1 Tax=Aliamphritea hakodatensis TaxID=2895352 RepID=UPI0022FDA621|nr:LysR substrate-binding domain-containing protein [Aliamphritea hakodatensis]